MNPSQILKLKRHPTGRMRSTTSKRPRTTLLPLTTPTSSSEFSSSAGLYKKSRHSTWRFEVEDLVTRPVYLYFCLPFGSIHPKNPICSENLQISCVFPGNILY